MCYTCKSPPQPVSFCMIARKRRNVKMEFYTCIAKYAFFGIRDEKLLATARKSWYHTMVCSGIEAVITGLTRNQFEGNLTWVRIPPAAPKIRPSAFGRWSYFWVPLPVVAPPQGNRTCSGQVNCPCAKALLRKILVTAHPRRPTLWGPGLVGIHTDMP